MSTLFLSPVNPPKTPHLKIDHMFMSCHDGHGLRKPFPDLLWWALRWASAGEGEGRDGVDMAIVAIVAAAAVDVEMCLLYATEYRGICRRMCFWAAAGTMEVMTISRKRQGMQIRDERYTNAFSRQHNGMQYVRNEAKLTAFASCQAPDFCLGRDIVIHFSAFVAWPAGQR